MINWTVIISVLGAAGIFAPVILKIFSSKIKKQLNEHGFELANHKIRIEKLEDDSDEYKTAIIKLSAAIKYLEKLEKKMDELSKDVEKNFRQILVFIGNKDYTSKKM